MGLTRAPGPVGLRREATEHGPTTRWLLFHEVGHQLDRFLSGSTRKFRSHQPDSPFGQSDNPNHYVDQSQVGSPHEDFTDCHACALYNFDQVKKNPDLQIHARGKVGEKMAWSLEQGYGETVPEPGERVLGALGQVDAGTSPFRDRAHFHREVNRYLDSPDLVQADSRAWLENKFRSL